MGRQNRSGTARGPRDPRRRRDPRDPLGLHAQPDAARWSRVEAIADRMDKPLTVAGVLFALLVLAETVLEPGGTLARVFSVLSWALWLAFAAEFAVRLLVAPSRTRFLRRSWWQLIFLALPFFRFLRPLSRLRVARLGRTLSAGIRSGRTASRRLSGRTVWLASLTAIVVLSASQILFAYGRYDDYGDALYAAALATITGTATGQDGGVVRVLDVVLAIYSVVVFAALAGILGAYFVERHPGDAAEQAAPVRSAGASPASAAGITSPDDDR